MRIAMALGTLASRLFARRWLLGLGLFAFLVLFRIHGVSLESWNVIVQDATPSYRYPSIGANRGIRSDEYAVSVPLVMAQCAHPGFFPRINERCGGTGMDMFISTPPTPVWDWTVVGQAANWGYFLFGFEHGLSWNWWLRYLLEFLFALEFFVIWLDGDRALAFVGALAVTLGAPTQWWTTTVPYLNLFFFASLVFLNKLFSWQQIAARLAAGMGLVVSLCSFSFSFYPPFQFLYGVALLLLGAEMVWLACRAADQRIRACSWLVLALAALALAAEWCYFLSVHQETLSRMVASSYPGARCCLGGSLRKHLDMQAWKFVSLFTSFRPVGFRNACVVSAFFVPTIAWFCATIRFGRAFARNSPFGAAVAAWVAVILLWMAFSWSETLARQSFFSKIPIERAAVVSGFLLLLLVFKTAQVVMRDKQTCSKILVAGCLCLSYGLLAVSLLVNPALRHYFVGTAPLRGVAMLALGILLLAAVTVSLLRANRRMFLGAYAVVALLSGAFVNPISQGAAPLMHKQLGEAIHAVVREHGEGLCVPQRHRGAVRPGPGSALCQWRPANGRCRALAESRSR